MEEVPFVKLKRKRGPRIKYGPDKESSRRETARQRDATKVYLLFAHDEWRTAKQAYEKKLTKPITNGEFASHLLSVHRRSKCPTCAIIEKGEDGVLPLADTETQTTCDCSCSCDSEEIPEAKDVVPKPTRSATRKSQHGARRRKQSAPQGLHRDILSDSEVALSPANKPQGAISTTTRLLQGIQSGENAAGEIEVFVPDENKHDPEENEDTGYLDEDGDNDYPDDNEGDWVEDDKMGGIPTALSPVRYKDDEEFEEWKYSEASDDPDDEDYNTHKCRKGARKARKTPPKVARKTPPRVVREMSSELVVETSRPRITMRLKTRPKNDAKEPSSTKKTPRGRRKRAPPKEKEEKPKSKAKGPGVFIRRVSWAELEKRYQCKICNFESNAPLQACRHLLGVHPEMISALREFLLTNTVQQANDEERTLYSIAMEQPLNPQMSQQGGESLQGDLHHPPNPGELQVSRVEAGLQHFTDMMMPGYIGATRALPHLAGMPSFQQSFDRPPLFDGSQNGMVPLAPHNLPAFSGAAATLFGMGVGAPEEQINPPNPYATAAGHQEVVSPASASPTTTHSSMVGMGLSLQGGPTAQSHNGIQHQTQLLHGGAAHQMETTRLPDCARQTISQPQSPSQASPLLPHQVPRPSSQPPPLPAQMPPQAHTNIIVQHPDLTQLLTPSHTEPLIHTDHNPKELSQTKGDEGQPPTDPSQRDPSNEQTDNIAVIGSANNGTGDSEEFKLAREVPVVKVENGGEDNPPREMPSVSSAVEADNPFEKEELLVLIERWVKIPLSCPHCAARLPYMKRSDRHRCRRPTPSILCDICGKSYPATYFRFHYRRVHLPQDNVTCQYCQREFRPSSISKHILEHHKPFRPFRCGICGKEFTSKKHCDKHEAVHKTEKPHKCPTCGRGFTQRTNMKNHMRQHTGEQPYRCHNCMKSFTHNVSLKNHLKRYHGIDLWQLGHTGGGRPKKESQDQSGTHSFIPEGAGQGSLSCT